MPDETDLLKRAREGDRDALRALLEAHGETISRQIGADIGKQWQSVLDADDVMQVTYLEAFLQIGRMTADTTGGFVTWLRRIAENNLRDAAKGLGRKKRPNPARRVQGGGGPDENSYVALVELLGATSSTPSRHAARDEASRLIHHILAQLPDDYRTVVQLYDLDCQEIGVVAERMGRSPGAVHMLRARAHDRLRGLLGAEPDFFSNTA